MQFDIIGDIHGEADKLIELLERLGYRLQENIYRHPDRTAVFVADFIDRRQQQMRTLGIVRPMVSSGAALAIMANHELNAIAYSLEDESAPGEYLRRHTHKNTRQHTAFLSELGQDPDLYRDTIDWFLELPLWLDLPGFRVVHACWDQTRMDAISGKLRKGNRLSRALMPEASAEGTELFIAVESITKGPEVAMPPGVTYIDPDGNRRERSRIKWWDPVATTFRTAVLAPPAAAAHLPDDDIPMESRIVYDNEKPLFIGHYWMTGQPRVLTPKIACVDYSAANGGDLVAYCWDGEDTLCDSRFFTSSTHPDQIPPRLRFE